MNLTEFRQTVEYSMKLLRLSRVDSLTIRPSHSVIVHEGRWYTYLSILEDNALNHRDFDPEQQPHVDTQAP